MYHAPCVRMHPACMTAHTVLPFAEHVYTCETQLRRVCASLRSRRLNSHLIVNRDISVSPRLAACSAHREREFALSRGRNGTGQHAGARVVGGKAEPRRGGESVAAPGDLLLSWRSRVVDVATCSPFSRSRCSASRHGYPRWTIRHQVKLIHRSSPADARHLPLRPPLSPPAPLCTIRTALRTLCNYICGCYISPSGWSPS